MKAIEKLRRFLKGKGSSSNIKDKKITYLDTKIDFTESKLEGDYVRVDFHLENGYIFQKKFEKMSPEYQNYWIYAKPGDEVTLHIYPDGIIRGIQ